MSTSGCAQERIRKPEYCRQSLDELTFTCDAQTWRDIHGTTKIGLFLPLCVFIIAESSPNQSTSVQPKLTNNSEKMQFAIWGRGHLVASVHLSLYRPDHSTLSHMSFCVTLVTLKTLLPAAKCLLINLECKASTEQILHCPLQEPVL